LEPDKVSGLMHENMAQDSVTCFTCTGSRHFKVEVANFDIFPPSNIKFGFGMRKMALILSKVIVVNAKQEHEL